MTSKYLSFLEVVASEDVAGLKKAEESYGDSWKKREGVSAFMIVDPKIDRLVKQCEKNGWDIFKAVQNDSRAEGAIDDIRDLRRYLMLVEAELRARGIVDGKQAGSAAEDKSPSFGKITLLGARTEDERPFVLNEGGMGTRDYVVPEPKERHVSAGPVPGPAEEHGSLTSMPRSYEEVAEAVGIGPVVETICPGYTLTEGVARGPDGKMLNPAVAADTWYLPDGGILDRHKGIRGRTVADMTDEEYAERRAGQHP